MFKDGSLINTDDILSELSVDGYEIHICTNDDLSIRLYFDSKKHVIVMPDYRTALLLARAIINLEKEMSRRSVAKHLTDSGAKPEVAKRFAARMVELEGDSKTGSESVFAMFGSNMSRGAYKRWSVPDE